MSFVGRFGRPYRPPPPTQPFSASFDSNINEARLDRTFADFTLATVVDVPRTLTLTQTIAPFTLTGRIGTINNMRLDETIESFTLSATIATNLNCPKFSEIAITGADASSEVYPRC